MNVWSGWTIAARLRVDARSVLLGVYAVATARITGANPVVAQLLVSNRFRPGLSAIVSNISQTGLLVADVAGITVDEAIARTRRASVNAYKHAYFDVAEWKAMLAAKGVELGSYYNDRPSPLPQSTVTVVPPLDVLRAALPQTSAPRWTNLPYFNERLMVTIDDAPGAVALLVLADTHYVPRQQMAALANEMEEVAVAAAVDPQASTKID
ncbi:hypothetical protein ABT297_19150 [Dactylosporangium sp. NPDC000555]|uniref:hypothetical protein n=1 Tax=Dactylosporangium sp. NPDC000555 TaxID=3154260 RepID=UPI0033193A70